MKRPRRKFCPCGNKIIGKVRLRFCSNVCYMAHKRITDKKNYDKHHPKLPKRKCAWCEKYFIPRWEAHKCCTRTCRDKTSLNTLREKNKLKPESNLITSKWASHGFIYQNNESRICESTDVLDRSSSQHEAEITKFVKTGGIIRTLAPVPNGKVPGASQQCPILNNWNIDDLMGFGYSNRFMEEIDIFQSHGGFDVE